MAFGTVTFHHPLTGGIKQAPVGFSWTTLFFGFFPALFRGHWAGAAIIFLLTWVTFGLGGLFFPFVYNKMYVRHLVGKGYRVSSATLDPARISARLGINLPLDTARPAFAIA